MKKIIIHAGLPKTGSTFLQENVFPALPAQTCAYNPERLRRLLVKMSKQVLCLGSLPEHEIDVLKQQVEQEIELIEADTILISIEGLLPIHCGGLQSGKNIFAVLKQLIDDAQIIIFIREQTAWIKSAYSFYLVNRYIFPFEEYVNRAGDGSFGPRAPEQLAIDVHDYDNQAIKDIATKYYGHVVCFCFEDLFSDKQASELERLAKVLGVDSLKPTKTQAVNKGLDERLMVIASRVVRYMPFRGSWKPGYLYAHYSRGSLSAFIQRFYLRKAGLVAMAIARLIYKYTNYAVDARLFSPSDIANIKDFYAEKNRAFWAKEPSP